MVFEPEATTTAEQSNQTDSGESLDPVDALARFSTLLEPFVQLLTVLVQLLTVVTLFRRI